MIAYANASSYKIIFDYNSNEGQLKKPVSGETVQKETDVFEVKFEPAKDHAFYKWQASSVDLPAGESIDDYIEFENALLPETKVTFKKSLSNIVIKATCPHLPYTNLTITGNNGKFSPSKGTYACIDTYSYQLTFDPDNDYEFVRWEVYTKPAEGPETIIDNGTYIKIADINNPDTTYNYVAAPADSDISVAVRPVVAERPQTISCVPIYGVDTTASNPIQVIFDHDMDERSIYYTEEEMNAILAIYSDMTIDSFFKTIVNNEVKYYGYQRRVSAGGTQQWQSYFKNIKIENSEGSSLIDDFEPPVFENPRMLSISPKRNALSVWTEVCVTLD